MKDYLANNGNLDILKIVSVSQGLTNLHKIYLTV